MYLSAYLVVNILPAKWTLQERTKIKKKATKWQCDNHNNNDEINLITNINIDNKLWETNRNVDTFFLPAASSFWLEFLALYTSKKNRTGNV